MPSTVITRMFVELFYCLIKNNKRLDNARIRFIGIQFYKNLKKNLKVVVHTVRKFNVKIFSYFL